MNEITRNVILDLLPLYLAGEVSEDTYRLVKKYLDSDPELAEMVQDETDMNLFSEIPTPFAQEKAMEKFTEAKKWMMIRTLGLNLIMALAFILIFTCMFLTLLAGKFMEVIGNRPDPEMLGKFFGF